MNANRRRVAAAIGALAVLFARRGAAGTSERTVTIDAFAFKPATLTVRRGERIVWTNADPVPHTVTAAGRFDSGAIAAGATWALTAATKGRFDYACAYHPTMRGTIVVE